MGSPKSLVVPMLIAFLAFSTLLAALGLLSRHSDDADSTSSARPRSQQPEPISRPKKPSPGQGPRQTAAIPADTRTTSPASTPVPTLSPAPTGPDVVLTVFPEVPQRARVSIQGTIRVGIKVQVDSFGNVIGSEVDLPGPSKYFARLATEAAEQWKFTPPKQNGQAVASDWTILFEYTRNGITQKANQSSQ